MRSIIVIDVILLAFLTQAHAEVFEHKADDKLIDNLLDRVIEVFSTHREDLDGTTLFKPGQLAISPRMGLVPSQAMMGQQSQAMLGQQSQAMLGRQSQSMLGQQSQARMIPPRRTLERRTMSALAVAEGASLAEGTEILKGKTALVTGASRGIGEAIAAALAKAGATVVGTATSDSGAEAITARGNVKGIKLDVCNQEDVDALLKTLNDEFGGVDILINNAGITKDGLMLMMKEPAWDAVIDTNLNSVFKMTKAVLRGMTKKKFGRIISISSVVGSMGNAGQTNYAAAKAGMEGFTRALAREVGSRGITVNAVAPGFIKSDMTDQLKDEWKDKLLESVPAGRLGTPKEIADAVLFLSSPYADYVTGHTLHVNGGMLMQ